MGKEAELIKAAKTGDIRTLEKHLSHMTKRTSVIGSMRKHLHPNIQDDLGYTLLHHATLNGHRETVSFLLKCGASTTIPDSSGSYPLHLASWKGDLEIVRLLVTQGPSRANVDQQSNTEDTALHLAAQYGYCSIVEFLLERHANPMIKNIRGETPLDLAAQFGHVDTVHVIISHCPEILRFSRPEISPLHLAARNGHSVVVLSLINAGIPINTMCSSGTALHEAALCGKEETVKLLLDKGIDITCQDKEGRTTLQLLSDYKAEKYRQIKKLIQDYSEKATVPGRYMKPRKYRLLAVAIRDSRNIESTKEGNLPALHFKESDAIVVQGRQSSEIYIGTLHKVVGTFPLKDTRLFQDISGKLHEVFPKNIIESPEDGTLHVLQQPYNFEYQQRKSMHVPRSSDKNKEDQPVRSLSTSEGILSEAMKEKKKKKTRMTDKEKKFILSKDTGAYSQLLPVKAPSPENIEVKEVTPPKEETAERGGYLGSYYLLEVANFETTPPLSSEGIPPPPSYPPPIPQRQSAERTRNSAPQYENIRVKSLRSEEVKPRSSSDGTLGQKITTETDLPQIHSKSFGIKTYENFPLKSTSSVDTVNEKSSHVLSNSNQDTIDRRGPMPLPISDMGETLPISIPTHARPQRKDYSDVENVTGDEDKKGKFKISNDYDDVIVSSFNPNYSKVDLRKKMENRTKVNKEDTTGGVGGASDGEGGTSGEEGRVISGVGGDDVKHKTSYGDRTSPNVYIIPQDVNPFAGLVQSSSVVSGLSEVGGYDDISSSPPRNRLLSIWDERRVDQEWTKIDDVLKTMTTSIEQYESTLTTPDTETTPTLNNKTETNRRSSVSIWLSGMGLRGYTNTLESNGFDDIKFIGGGILDVEDLKEMGIYDNDQGTIMVNAAILPSPPRLRHVTSVEEWLTGLHLSHLEGYFEGYTLEKLASLWEIQLSTVLGIELLGYRKRLLYGIREIRAGHPDWTKSPRLAIKELHSKGFVPSPMSDVTFTRDYSHIRALRKTYSDVTPTQMTKPAENISHLNTTTKDTVTPPTTNENLPQEQTPPEVPVRGGEYATIRQDQRETLKKTVFIPPPAESKNYHTWYLGSALVKGLAGKHSAEEACLKLRTQTDGIAKMPQIILSISWKGVKFVDAVSKMVVSTHLIRDISHCCPDIEDPRVFAYMTKEKETNQSYCHVFMVQSKDIADEIIMTVGQAFEVAYQAVVRARSQYKSPTRSPKKSSKPISVLKPFPELSSSRDLTDNGVR